MRAASTDEASVVMAAQAGDRRAIDQLVETYLPFVYNIVGRALSGHPDVDDVVQETMLRALRSLPSLRTPEGFRTWLATIAVNQVGTYLHRRDVAGRRAADLDQATEVADGDFEELTILRLGLSGQRRQAVLASRWLDADERALLSLWWLETAGQLGRAQLAAAMGLTLPHAAVRVQRMLDQLELSRAIVAALAARPGCAQLGAVLATWDGRPSPLWRKRIGRHVRGCAVCTGAAEGMVPTARLLVGVALVPIPLALASTVLAKAAASAPAMAAAATAAMAKGGLSATGLAVPGGAAKTGLFGKLAHVVGAHPVATAVAGATIIAGAAAIVVLPTPPAKQVTAPPPTTPAVVTSAAPTSARPSRPPKPTSARPTTPKASPTAAAIRSVPHGFRSLESTDEPGQFVTLVDDLGTLAAVDPNSPADTRQRATFEVVAGLADARCISLRVPDGRYLRHTQWRPRLADNDDTVLFREDSTFCPRAGTTSDSVALESYNYPGRYLRHLHDALWVDPTDGTAAFRAGSSFRVRPGLAS
jgi:RNA polymerase sigma factor (sigma-70 family)